MKDIKIVFDGPTCKDVKLVELDGKDITSMTTSINFHSDVSSVINRIDISLIGNVYLEIIAPLDIEMVNK